MENLENKQLEEAFSISQAADYSHVTRQAVYIALRKGNLRATKKGRRWVILKSDLEEYRLSKYNRDKRKFNNELIFDVEKGHFSVQQVCKVISSTLKRPYPIQHIYYLMRAGKLKAFRKGCAWVISKEDAVELLQKEKENDGEYAHEMRMV